MSASIASFADEYRKIAQAQAQPQSTAVIPTQAGMYRAARGRPGDLNTQISRAIRRSQPEAMGGRITGGALGGLGGYALLRRMTQPSIKGTAGRMLGALGGVAVGKSLGGAVGGQLAHSRLMSSPAYTMPEEQTER